MNEFLVLVVFLAAWIVLNRWILPWMGVPTCMGGACATKPRFPEQGENK